MAKTKSNEIALGTKAIDFTLNDQITNKPINLVSCKGDKATVIIFMCNHCPFVIHIIDQFIKFAKDFDSQNIQCIAINSNDTDAFPEDSPEKMKEFAIEHSMTFPYLFDKDQEIAKSYNAACTPDIYVYDQNLLLSYHGRFDPSTPSNKEEITGSDLRNAVNCIINDKEIAVPQYNSMGCNIKWK